MAKVLMTVELDYDADIAHGDDPEAIAWFFGEILSDGKGLLLLHSNEIGDCIGKVRVLSATPSNAPAQPASAGVCAGSAGAQS
jgi:hypothetical protein